MTCLAEDGAEHPPCLPCYVVVATQRKIVTADTKAGKGTPQERWAAAALAQGVTYKNTGRSTAQEFVGAAIPYRSPRHSMSAEATSAVSSNVGWTQIRATLLRHLMFPAYCYFTSWERADAVFRVEGERLLELASSLPEDDLARPVQIEIYVGLDEGPCLWSANMVLEHSIVLGSFYAEIMVDLSRGHKPRWQVDAPANISQGTKGHRILEDFERFLDDYQDVLAEGIGDRNAEMSHPHPSLGELTVSQWHCLASFHQTVHCRYMERIISVAGNGSTDIRAR